MAINYERVNWDTTKYVNPTNMNQMDIAIKEACDGVDELGESIITISEDVETLQTVVGTVQTDVGTMQTNLGQPSEASEVTGDSAFSKISTINNKIDNIQSKDTDVISIQLESLVDTFVFTGTNCYIRYQIINKVCYVAGRFNCTQTATTSTLKLSNDNILPKPKNYNFSSCVAVSYSSWKNINMAVSPTGALQALETEGSGNNYRFNMSYPVAD